MSIARSKDNSTNFQRLYVITLIGVVLAAVLYYVWAANPNDMPRADNRAEAAAPKSIDERSDQAINEAYGRIEMSFEANRGQTDSSVGFLARGTGYALFLKPDEAVFALSRNEEAENHTAEMAKGPAGGRLNSADPNAGSGPGRPPSVLRLQLVGGNARAEAAGADELDGKANYFVGSDPSQWRTDISTYGRVRYREVYKGIDIEYYGNQRRLEYDFHVEPGADYRQISIKFAGAESLKIEDDSGDLLIGVDGQTVRQHKPVVYQELNGERQEIEGRFAVDQARRVGFEIGQYDATKPLIIDPVLVYSTYLGGNGEDAGYAVAVDSAGNTYVTGTTSSTTFPTVNALQGSRGGNIDVFVTKINTTGNAFVYSTYLGGSANDRSYGIALDSSGNPYVTGYTLSTNFGRAVTISRRADPHPRL